MKFTKEQLIRRAHLTVSRGARELENHPDRDGVAVDIKIASIAAMALMAEPIYQLWDEGYYDTEKETYDAALKTGGRGRIVYTAPPAPVAVPDCFLNAVSALESLYRNGQKQNWNERYTTDMAYASGVLKACRAAMLQGADSELQRKAAIHDVLCEKYNVESLADFVDWQRNHIAELEAAPPAPVGPGETAVMPDYPGYVMTQRECFQTGWKAHHVAMLQSGAPVQFGWSKGHFGYQTLFNAIGKAVNIQGGALSISVSAFEDAMLAAAPQQEDL